MRKSARTQIPPFFDNDPYKVRMHIITVSVITFLQLKCSFLMCLKKGLFTEIEKKKKEIKDSQKGNKIFWVGPIMGG